MTFIVNNGAHPRPSGSFPATAPTASPQALTINCVNDGPQLWHRAAARPGHAGFRCAQQQVACAEVELVHAGNEHHQQAWRHAKPCVQIADDLLDEAQERLLSAGVLFNFDQHGDANLRPCSVAQLEALVQRVARAA